MTTIDEMDEFFNFEDAAQTNSMELPADIDFATIDFTAGPYNPNLVFAQEENDEDSFTCLQHFSPPGGPGSSLLINPQDGSVLNTAMMGPTEFTDFPRWIDGMNVPSNPCEYCRRMKIHCKVIREGVRKGSCTSCVALARSCSLNHPTRQLERPRDTRKDYPLLYPENTITNDDESNDIGIPTQPSYNNKRIPCEGDEDGIFPTGPVTMNRYCDFATKNMLLDTTVGNDNTKPAQNWGSLRSPLDSPIGSSYSRPVSQLGSKRNSEEDLTKDAGEGTAKIGARFSRESVRILRSWLSTHHRHPYPTEEEKESLQRQTGLNKTQITNWLANARRRGKVRAPRSTSPSVKNYPNGIDIPRKSTPAMEEMNPLERWKNSPPEHEPASVTAIAKAVTSSTFSSDRSLSPQFSYGNTEDGSGRSICRESSASSLGTSQSSAGSFASAFSHKSRASWGSFGSFGKGQRRRRRRQAPKEVKVPKPSGPVRTFQCTFCTETFKTKHDWQRHEKSLHLSLERWVCSPDGPTVYCPEYDRNHCVFCGLPNPPNGHAESHNHSGCADRSLEERTFYRKDHLRQHLNLVHDVKFQTFSMETWKVATPEIRSRCGFCGIVMDSWSFRVDHLAEHFKGGKSMADWKGDWGFEAQVLDIVENGMPPYLIHDERNSPEPFSSKPDTRTLEDLIKIGLVEYLHTRVLTGAPPTDEELLEEARKIVKQAEEFATQPGCREVSWFRDLIMYAHLGPRSPTNTGTEKMSWARNPQATETPATYNKSEKLALSGCSKERQLKDFVIAKQALGLTPIDFELQNEACRILDEAEVTSNYKCKSALSWFKYLVNASKDWLADFRKRAHLPRSSEMFSEQIRSTDPTSIDYSIHNEQRLENEMIEWVKIQRLQGITPTDADIQHHARMIVYKNGDPWNQTVMDNSPMLYLFKRQQGLAPDDSICPVMPPLQESTLPTQLSPITSPAPRVLHWDLEDIGSVVPKVSASPNHNGNNGHQNACPATAIEALDQPLHTRIQNQPSTNTNPTQPLRYFLNDANCYGRLVRELSRFVTSCTSANNPNRYIPTDDEIQKQARWTVYDDDDPWNQTAADNEEWLVRFKRDVGLAPPEEGPGLPISSKSWAVDLGGSGFEPPYIYPAKPCTSLSDEVMMFSHGRQVGDEEPIKDKVYKIKPATAQKFVSSIGTRYPAPPTVFCSRKLEGGLNEFLTSQIALGIFPTDEDLKAKAREILGAQETAADDVHLLEKFKAIHAMNTNSQSVTHAGSSFSNEAELLAGLDNELAMSGGAQELSNMAMDFDMTSPGFS
ncbi:hypothetical protein HYFRA_00002294 [Hymenoscyphus fraxineus]|uniref:Uncharacterized protein n=1 Tax=Hymenoscyphus fraxineus TaxID=746836 RepID=A0A9N9Q0H5_9HELO|nr:hypothetical protein HYFRA_00002294 [Hymenoscyphus fraxineus]